MGPPGSWNGHSNHRFWKLRLTGRLGEKTTRQRGGLRFLPWAASLFVRLWRNKYRLEVVALVELIKHPLTQRLGALKMYRDELDQLVELVKKSCATVVISNKKYRFVSLDEMKEHEGARIRELEIRGEKPDLQVVLSRRKRGAGTKDLSDFSELRTREITEDAESLFYQIRGFLEPYERTISNGLYMLGFIIGSIIILGSVLVPGITGVLRVWIGSAGCAMSVPTFILLNHNGRNCLSLDLRLRRSRFSSEIVKSWRSSP